MPKTASPKRKNPLRMDPTRTISIRRAFITKLRRKFSIIRGQLVKMIAVEDAFGLKERKSVTNCGVSQLRDATTGRCGPGIGVDIPRNVMPQIPTTSMPEFKEYCRVKGVDLVSAVVSADELSPTQKEFRQERVNSITDDVARNTPVIISADDYVLDGTHRWVKLWQADKKSTVKALRLGLDLHDALDLMRGFPGVKFAANAFCPTGPGGGIDPSCSPGNGSGVNPESHESYVSRAISFIERIPKALYARIKDKVKAKYGKLKDRYGSKFAKAIIGAAMIGLPIPAPGASLALAAPVVALAELHRLFTHHSTATHNDLVMEPHLTEQEIAWAAKKLIRELQEELTLSVNVFCPTGEGGGVDPTCPPGGVAPAGQDRPYRQLTMFPDAEKTNTLLEKVKTEAGNIKFIEQEDASPGIERHDYRAIRGAMTDRELDDFDTEMMEHRDNYINEVVRDSLREFNVDHPDATDEERESAEEEASERANDNYQDDPYLEREYLREFYDRHSDEPRFKGDAPKDVWVDTGDNELRYGFSSTNGNDYTISADKSTIYGGDVARYGMGDAAREALAGSKSMNIEFANESGGGRFSVTGSGAAREVFSKVVPAVVAAVKKEDPDVITFSASEPSRQKLYSRLVKTIAHVMPSYSAFTAQTNDGHGVEYVITKSKIVDHVKSYAAKRYGTDIKPLVNTKRRVKITDIKSEVDPRWFTDEGWTLTDNVFCATGDGGGVDPTCSPGGSSTPLPAQAAKAIHTPEFKSWFGDWEHNPNEASKVVDKDGKPQVEHPTTVFTGVHSSFEVFDKDHIATDVLYGKGFYFTEDPRIAEAYAHSTHRATDDDTPAPPVEGKVMQCFLNARKPFDLDKIVDEKLLDEAKVVLAGKSAFVGRDTFESATMDSTYHRNSGLPEPEFGTQYAGQLFDAAKKAHGAEGVARLTEFLQAKGYDSVVRKDNWAPGKGELKDSHARTWVVFESTQVKSVDNKGTFNPHDPSVHNSVPEVLQGIHNVFCPTGPGGGVDPSCSPEEGGSSSELSEVNKALNSAPAVDDHSPEAKQWVKDHQHLYDTNKDFRTTIDAITAFTQGQYKPLRAFAEKAVTGKMTGDKWDDEPLEMESLRTTYFEGQLQGEPISFSDAAKALVNAINDAPKSDKELYRGTAGERTFNKALALKEGDSFDFNGPMSFSTSEDVANDFAHGNAGGAHTDKNDTVTIFKIKSGANALPVSHLSPWDQKEVLTMGKFKVVGTKLWESSGGGSREMTVTLEQVGQSKITGNCAEQKHHELIELLADRASPFPGRPFPSTKKVANQFCPTGEGGGVDPTCSPSTATNAMIDRLKKSGGFTFVPAQRKYRGIGQEGFSVSPYPERSKVYDKALKRSDVKQFMKANRDLLTKPGHAVGAWHNPEDGKTYLDVSIVTRSRDEAIKLGREHNQISIFDFKSGNTVDTGGTGTHNSRPGRDGRRNRQLLLNAPGDRAWQFASDPEKVKAFQAWIKQQLYSTLTIKSDEQLWEDYAKQGYLQGAGRAFDDIRQTELRRRRPELFSEENQDSLRDFYQGSREEFLKSSFGQPESVNKIKLLAGRSFTDLDNVTADMSTRMSRELVDGLTEGKHPKEIAKDMLKVVDLGQYRAEMIAQTEIIRAHAEGQLDSFKKLGVEEVGVEVEWATADDNAVCDECDDMQGVTLSVDEARGMIPRHPNCRCAFVPANVGEKDPTGSTEDTKSEAEDVNNRRATLNTLLRNFDRVMNHDHSQR